MKLKKIFWGVIFSALLMTVFFFFKWESAKDRVANDVLTVNSSALSSRSQRTADATNSAAVNSKVATNPPIKQKPFAGSLPPPNLPLTKVVDLLKKESDAGNYRASCRLGAELLRCQLHPLTIKENAKLQQGLASLEVGSEKYLSTVNKLKYQQERIASDSPVCDGFTNSDNLEAWRFEFIAGLQGHIASKAQFVASPPMNPIEFYKNMDGWAAYKEYAPKFLLDAANAGNKRARWSLARAYAGEVTLPGLGNLGGVELAKPDPYQAAIYAHTLAMPDGEPSTQRAAARLIKQIEQQLTPEKIVSAKAESAALRATWAPETNISAENAAPTAQEQRSFDRICDEP